MTFSPPIKKGYGEEMANGMGCESACFAMIGEIFSFFGFEVKWSLKANMGNDGRCQFRVEKK